LYSRTNLEKKVTTEHLWCGRHVKVIDGSTVFMPDTEALHCVEVDHKTHSRLRLKRIPLSMIDLLVLVSPLGKTSVDAVFIV